MKQLGLTIVGILVSLSVLATSELPDIGSSSSRVFSISEEQAVGDDYMRQLRAFAPIINDAEINDYIQHLGFKLVENNADAQDRKFSFFVIRENTINAFAMPGGYIGINSGLISRSDTESELASVLAHEVAHVTHVVHVEMLPVVELVPIIKVLHVVIVGSTGFIIGIG